LKILVIACDKSGYPAMIKYTTENTTDHELTSILKVPCLGSVKESDILALEKIAHEVNQLCHQFPLYPDLVIPE
jgi:coenzyme F420-reducing hydrogenase delta subunit